MVVVPAVDRQELRGRLRRLREDREFDDATVLLAAALERTPRDRALTVEMGRLHLDRGDTAEALEIFTRLAKRAPTFEPAVAWRIAALHRSFAFDEALAYAADALDRFADGADVRTAAIRLYADRGREAEALDLCDALLRGHPGHPDLTGALLDRIDLLRQFGRRPDAIEAARAAVARRPDDPEVLSAAGLSLTTSAPGLVDEGLAHLRRALEIDPENAAALARHGEALRGQLRWTEAEDVLRDAIMRRPRVPDLHVELAYALDGLHRDDEALVCCADALKIDPRHRWALGARVDFLRALRRWDDAERAARELTGAHPRDSYSHVRLGAVYDDQDRHDEALAAYDRALALDPLDDEALEWRVTSLRRLARWPEAERAARDAVALRPHRPRLRTELAWVLWGRDDAESALAESAKAAAQGPRTLWTLRSNTTLLRLSNHLPEAESAARALAEAFPREPDAHVELAQVLAAQNDHEPALAAYDRALSLDPAGPTALVGRARELGALGRSQDAATAARAAIAAAPDDPEPRIVLAMALMTRDIDEALDIALEALRLDPRNAGALWARVDGLRTLRRWDEAETAARELIEFHPESADAHWSLGQTLGFQDRHEEALAEYGRAVRLDPGHLGALIDEARTLRRLRRHADAVTAWQAVAAASPADPGPRLQLAQTLADQGRGDDAMDAIAEALRIDPRNQEVLLWRVSLLRRLRRWDAAERAARELLAEHPGMPRARMNLAWVLHDQDRHADALEQLDLILADDPGDPAALNERVSVLRALCRWSEAESAARAALETSPGDVFALVSLAWALIGQRRYHDALTHVTEALSRRPDYQWALLTHVRVLRLMRRWTAATEAARILIDAHPESADSYVNLAWVLRDQNRDADALAEYDRALELDPLHENALEWRITSLRESRRWADAERAAREAIRLLPHVPNLHAELAETHAGQARYPEALSAVERALELDPWYEWAHDVRADLLMALGRGDEAEAAARAYAAARPDQFMAHGILAGVLDAQHRYAEALTEFEATRRIDPYDPGAVRGMSAAYRGMRCFSEAERLLDSALAQAPDDPDLLAEMAFVRMDRGAFAAADQGFARVGELAAGPNSRASARAGRGWVALNDGRHDDAVGHFMEAVGFDPTSAEHRVGLGWALLRRGRADDLARADEACHAALGLSSHTSQAHSCLGTVAFRRGEHAVAEHHFRRSIELAPYDGSHLDLGALYVLTGRYADAEPCLRRALELDPWSARAHVELGNLYLRRSDGAADGALDPDGARDARAAAAEFRQALAIEQGDGAASLGLALALVRSSGDLAAAEEVLRAALRQPAGDLPAWQLHLALARLLVQAGDATQDTDLYREAVDAAGAAIRLAAGEPDPYLVAGVAEQRLGAGTDNLRLRLVHRRRAVEYLKNCQNRDPGHTDAARALRRLEEEREVVRAGRAGSTVLVTVATGVLVALWVDFMWKHHVTTVMATTLTPVLVGLIAIGFLLPLLVRLKVPGGLEADLSASLGHLSTGPTGKVTISSPRFSAGSGPSGQIPRLT